MLTSSSGADVGLWYERYAPSLRSVAARVTGDPDDADDALHDAFLAAWRYRGSFDAAPSPLPWLAGVAQRKALHLVSRRSRPLNLPSPSAAPSAEDEALRLAADTAARGVVRAE